MTLVGTRLQAVTGAKKAPPRPPLGYRIQPETDSDRMLQLVYFQTFSGSVSVDQHATKGNRGARNTIFKSE